jgi:molybdopterin-guanine dinucleotide biosynthesis protein A
VADFDAIVLAGGAARRLDGADKGAVEIGPEPMLRHALAAVRSARVVTVVGPESNRAIVYDSDRPVTFVRESPPAGGPAAGLYAGLQSTGAEVVVALACDMPFVTEATVRRLLDAADGTGDGALLVDHEGRRQFLAAAYRRTALLAAYERLDAVDGAPMHRVVERLTLAEVGADPDEATDVDTWADVDRSRRRWEEA